MNRKDKVKISNRLFAQNGPIGFHKHAGPITVNAVAVGQPEKGKDARIIFNPGQEVRRVGFVLIRQRHVTTDPEQLKVSVVIAVYNAILGAEWVQVADERVVHVAGTATKVVSDVGEGGGGEEEVHEGDLG